jgi:hypothetical protein
LTVIEPYYAQLRQGIVWGIEFDYDARHQVGICCTQDSINQRSWDVSYRFRLTYPDSPVINKHLKILPLLKPPHYHVGPPLAVFKHMSLELIKWAVTKESWALQKQFELDFKRKINECAKQLNSHYDLSIRREALELWMQSGQIERKHIALWSSIREKLREKGLPCELQLIIMDMAFLAPYEKFMSFGRLDELRGDRKFIRQGNLILDSVSIINPMESIKPQHMDCLSDYYDSIRHDADKALIYHKTTEIKVSDILNSNIGLN